jgi:hypothetical protein
MSVAERVARFWSRVDRSGDCWLWTGARYPRGYGMVACGRGTDGRLVNNYAHRVAYILTHGPLPISAPVVRHRCDNPPCCNPAHLCVGTQADNINDAAVQGKYRRERPGAWIHTREMRDQIVARVAAGVKIGQLATELNISRQYIYKLIWSLDRRQREATHG